jgi:hypothetical protein
VTAVHAGIGIAMVAVNLAAALLGAWQWWRRAGGALFLFWRLLRAGQALTVLAAADGLILVIAGEDLPELHLVYGLTPIGVSFLAEQLRLASADTVLAARDLEDAQAMRVLPESEQHAIVHQIMRRELGVMAASAFVVAVLGLRAGGWL